MAELIKHVTFGEFEPHVGPRTYFKKKKKFIALMKKLEETLKLFKLFNLIIINLI